MLFITGHPLYGRHAGGGNGRSHGLATGRCGRGGGAMCVGRCAGGREIGLCGREGAELCERGAGACALGLLGRELPGLPLLGRVELPGVPGLFGLLSGLLLPEGVFGLLLGGVFGFLFELFGREF